MLKDGKEAEWDFATLIPCLYHDYNVAFTNIDRVDKEKSVLFQFRLVKFVFRAANYDSALPQSG